MERTLREGWGWRALARLVLLAAILYHLWAWLLLFVFGGGLGRYAPTAIIVPLAVLLFVGGMATSIFTNRRRRRPAIVTGAAGLTGLVAHVIDDSYFSTLDGSFRLGYEDPLFIWLPPLLGVALAYWLMGLVRPPTVQTVEDPRSDDVVT